MKTVPIVLVFVLLILCLGSGCVMLVDPNAYPVYSSPPVVVTQPYYYSYPTYVVSPTVVYPTYPVYYRTYYYGGYYYSGHPWQNHRGHSRH